jgi:hypothetical protein
MGNIEKCKEDLILFVCKQIEEKSLELNTSTFDFFIDNTLEEGDTLKEFKLINKSLTNELIKQSLTKAINEELFVRFSISSLYSDLMLSKKGMMLSKAILLNKEKNKKKIFEVLIIKILVPIVIAVISGFALYYFGLKD